MNTSILQKCLNELDAEKPRLDYIRGMLETLIEMQDNIGKPLYADTMHHPSFDKLRHLVNDKETFVEVPKDEADILEAATRARVASVRSLADKTTEIT